MSIPYAQGVRGSRGPLIILGVIALVIIPFFLPQHIVPAISPSLLPGRISRLAHLPLRLKEEPSWLLATIVGAQNQQRRNIIRSTWQRLFANPDYDFRFVIANYSDIWAPLLKAENETHGDIICLSHIPEDRQTANHFKTMEFFRYLTGSPNQSPKRYKWVSKVDDDTFLNPKAFHAEFLVNQTSANRTLIGMTYAPWQSRRNYTYASGRFYTISWDLVEVLSSLYAGNPIHDEHEDALVTRLLYEGHEWYNIVGYEYERHPNIGDSGWINNQTYMMHFLKDETYYLQVASLFDETGYSGRKISGITEFDPKFPPTKSIEDRKEKEANNKKKQEKEAAQKKEEEEANIKKVGEDRKKQEAADMKAREDVKKKEEAPK